MKNNKIKLYYKLILIILLSSGIINVFGVTQSSKSEIKDIGSELSLFVDDWLIEKMTNLRLQLHSPITKEIVFRFDKGWEGKESGYVTLFKDDEKYRMYYRGGGESTREYSCMAESTDGIHWIRPNLGMIDFEGDKENNIFFTGKRKSYDESHNFTPFKDTNPKAISEQKYKAVALKILPDGTGDDRKMLVGLISPDGIHWSLLTTGPIIKEGAFDSQNLAFWDSLNQTYVSYFRIGREGKRSIGRSISKDFMNWSSTEYLDFENTPLEHFYTNAIQPYFRSSSLFLGFPMRFVPERKSIGIENKTTDGLSDAVLISSHDGIHFYRKFMEAFIRPGLSSNNWGNAHGNNTPAWGILSLDENEISIYWMENYGDIPQMRRGIIRTDGFASLHANYPEGELITKPITFRGNRLFINYSTSAIGYIKIEILDLSGKPIPGFELDKSPEIYGDEIHREVIWKNNPGLKNLNGKPLHLRFILKDADLYSFQFGD